MDYARYLRSKITVDDRALNMGVLQNFELYVREAIESSSADHMSIVEVGAGVGAMFTRLYNRKSILACHKPVEYTLVEIKEDLLNAAKEDVMRLDAVEIDVEIDVGVVNPEVKNTPSSAIRQANVGGSSSIHTLETIAVETTTSTVTNVTLTNGMKVNFVHGDALKFLAQRQARFDAVIAAAVLDLWDVDEALPTLIGCLNPSSPVRAFYFPINFDGVTDFFPPSSEGASFDSNVERVFHSCMGHRTTLGECTLVSHTGRRLIPTLQHHGVSLKSVGGSSWTVYPGLNRLYHADEKYFLNCILSFVEETVVNSKSTPHKLQEGDAFKKYLESRRKQLEKGALYYLAHNIDVFCIA